MPKLGVAANPPLAPPFLTPAKLNVQADLDAQVVRNGATIAVMADKSAPRLLVPENHSLPFPSLLPMPGLQAGIEGFVTPGGVIQPSQLFQPTISLTTPPLRVEVPEIRTPEVFAPVDIGPGKPTESRKRSADRFSDRQFKTNPVSPPLGTPHPPPTGSGSPTPDLPLVPIPDCFRYPLSEGCREEYSPPEDVPEDVPAPAPEPVRIREGCTIRLGAEISGDRDLPHWWLTEAATDFEEWAGQSLDSLAMPWGNLDQGTFRRIRSINSNFAGYLMCFPTGLTWHGSLAGDFLDRTRHNTGFLRTARDLSHWAIHVDNGSIPKPDPLDLESGVHRIDFLPYLGQPDDQIVPRRVERPRVGWPPGVPEALETLTLDCNPRPFAVDPSDGRATLAESIKVFCQAFEADGVRLDETNVGYTPDSAANRIVRVANPRLNPGCAIPGIEHSGELAVPYALQIGGTRHFTIAPYVSFHPKVCAGRNAANDPQKLLDCTTALNRELMGSLGQIARDPMMVTREGRPPLRIWLNLYAALFNRRDGVGLIKSGTDIADGPINMRYGYHFVSVHPENPTLAQRDRATRELLGNGGWFEEFVLNSEDELRNYPGSVTLAVPGPLPFTAEVDASKKRVALSGGMLPFDEHVCVYRMKYHNLLNWRAQVTWFARTGRHGGSARADIPVTSVDEVQGCLASYLLCRVGTSNWKIATDDPTTWPEIREGQEIPPRRGARLYGTGLSVFPKWIYPRDASRPGVMGCGPEFNAGVYQCRLPGVVGHFDIPEGDGVDRTMEHDDLLPNQRPKPYNPLVAMATIGGHASRPDGSSPTTALRLLLDVQLGEAVGWAVMNGMYLARFEFGEVVHLPVPGENLVSADFRVYQPTIPNGDDAFYFSVDVEAVDALADGKLVAQQALTGRIPDWAALPPPEKSGRGFDPIVVRRVLESGLQSVDANGLTGLVGTPGVCLRWAGARNPPIALLPGMGRILIYANSPIGRRILPFFPFEAETGVLRRGPPRRIASTVKAFLGAPKHTPVGVANTGPSDRSGLSSGLTGQPR